MESYKGIINTKLDALYLIEAARKELIPMISRRLSCYEQRTCIKSGAVFIWCEKRSKIKRWTDGRKWSASRVKGSFLSYKEMIAPKDDNTCHVIQEKDNGLIKQSFTRFVEGEKFHVISYITSNETRKYQNPSLDKRFKDLKVLPDKISNDSTIENRKRILLECNDDISNNCSIIHDNEEYLMIKRVKYNETNQLPEVLQLRPRSFIPIFPLPKIIVSTSEHINHNSKPFILPPLREIVESINYTHQEIE